MGFAYLLMLGSLPLLLVCSAFFSGSETALFSLSPHQRLRFARSGTLASEAITKLLAETRGLLITLLLSNMTINVLFFVTSSVLLIHLGREGLLGPVLLGLATLAPLLGIILLGEVLPKLVAARLPMTWARVVALPLYLVHRLLAPVRVGASVAIITPLARLIAPPDKPPALSPEELESLLNLSQRQGVIDSDEEQLLRQVLELNQLKVRDLMVPRVDIEAFDLANDPSEMVELIARTKLRHLPVYRDSLDEIVGMVYARQVLLHRPTTREALEKYIRQVKFVPEQQRADQLLLELRKTGTTFAIVVDEYGGTAGLVTIEDVVEHMVGDLPGEFEPAGEPEVEHVSPGVWRVDAQLSVHDWADVFGHNPAVAGLAELEAVRTVGGLVMARLGRVPQVGDRTTLGNVQITVERMAGRRVDTVLIELQSAGRPPQPSDKEPTP
ncbi:hemolysin family protein [Phycisphaerales bacterium AB-hyl4]|uniref:Hemolysin family protein n=1 Tax=Natronomicrosphaera hydrolytica TaxID=3242702 RepID=A0ABV4U6U0_9BACT